MSDLVQMSDFALSLLRECSEKSTVLSPLSIGLLLAMVHAGANGDTKKQIREAIAKGASDEELTELFVSLSKAVSTNSDVTVSIACRMFLRSTFTIEQNYLDVIKKNFNALAQTLNFDKTQETAKTINGFVEEATHGKIKDLVDAGTFKEDTMAVLVNAIYFSGKWSWSDEFEKDNTQPADFFPADGTKRQVDMMYNVTETQYNETDRVQVLSLKYRDDAYTFDYFLPKENVGLAKFLASVTGKELQNLLSTTTHQSVYIRVPKMELDSDMKLKSLLQKIGVKDMFDDVLADLTGIWKDPTKEKNLVVSEVLHKARIEVDEEGTEAAAAGAITFTPVGGVGPTVIPKYFTANRPFLFTLSKNRSPMFIGVFQ